MSKAKTNALDALRGLIAERQQYEQWISALEAKREGTPEHVFERVQSDYRGRLGKVVADIRGHAEELQLSISTMSSRLVEVAREEDTRREGLQEAELRAGVGEYEPQQWEHLKGEAEQALGKIAADRASLDAQLGELRAIQKLSEVGSVGEVSVRTEATDSGASADLSRQDSSQSQAPSASGSGESVTTDPASVKSPPVPAPFAAPATGSGISASASVSPATVALPVADAPRVSSTAAAPAAKEGERPSQDQVRLPLEPVVAAASTAASTTGRPRSGKTPPAGVSAIRPRSDAVKPDQSKTLKCPECGTPNYATEWYCERCGGELATM